MNLSNPSAKRESESETDRYCDVILFVSELSPQNEFSFSYKHDAISFDNLSFDGLKYFLNRFKNFDIHPTTVVALSDKSFRFCVDGASIYDGFLGKIKTELPINKSCQSTLDALNCLLVVSERLLGLEYRLACRGDEIDLGGLDQRDLPGVVERMRQARLRPHRIDFSVNNQFQMVFSVGEVAPSDRALWSVMAAPGCAASRDYAAPVAPSAPDCTVKVDRIAPPIEDKSNTTASPKERQKKRKRKHKLHPRKKPKEIKETKKPEEKKVYRPRWNKRKQIDGQIDQKRSVRLREKQEMKQSNSGKRDPTTRLDLTDIDSTGHQPPNYPLLQLDEMCSSLSLCSRPIDSSLMAIDEKPDLDLCDDSNPIIVEFSSSCFPENLPIDPIDQKRLKSKFKKHVLI